MLLMEAFSCDQVSVNPVTFTTCYSQVLLSVRVGHPVASNVKPKEMRHFITCVTSIPTKHPLVQLPCLLMFL